MAPVFREMGEPRKVEKAWRVWSDRLKKPHRAASKGMGIETTSHGEKAGGTKLRGVSGSIKLLDRKEKKDPPARTFTIKEVE